MKILYVGVGGFFGAIARYLVGGWVLARYRGDFPVATFVINVSGSFILGLFMAFATGRFEIDPRWRLLIAIGFVGAYTTFSTFEYETERLTSAGGFALAGANILLSVAVGFFAVWLGMRLGGRI
jgi:CrcB protein